MSTLHPLFLSHPSISLSSFSFSFVLSFSYPSSVLLILLPLSDWTRHLRWWEPLPQTCPCLCVILSLSLSITSSSSSFSPLSFSYTLLFALTTILQPLIQPLKRKFFIQVIPKQTNFENLKFDVERGWNFYNFIVSKLEFPQKSEWHNHHLWTSLFLEFGHCEKNVKYFYHTSERRKNVGNGRKKSRMEGKKFG